MENENLAYSAKKTGIIIKKYIKNPHQFGEGNLKTTFLSCSLQLSLQELLPEPLSQQLQQLQQFQQLLLPLQP